MNTDPNNAPPAANGPGDGSSGNLQHDPQARWWTKVPIGVKSAIVGVAGVAVAATGLVAPANSASPGDLDTLANGCSIEGSAQNSQWQWSANALKNRWHLPSDDDDFNGNVSIQALAAATSDPKPSGPNSGPLSASVTVGSQTITFNEGQWATIDGYIAYVKVGGVESCNCGSNDTQYMDTHIYVSPDPAHANQDSKANCVIVEVTPRVRIEVSQMQRNWNTDNLISTLKPGTHVKMSGYLFDDQEHRPNSAADGASGNVWRATCWELHPVTDIEVVADADSSQTTSDASTGTKDAKKPQ